MNIGDHLVTPRTGYTHHGLYIGNGEVIHYSGCADGFSSGEIVIASLDAFANGHGISVKNPIFRVYDADESVERAYSRLGEDWYNVLLNNCEQFVTWCIQGLHSSPQVNNAISAISVAYNVLTEENKRQTIEAVATVAVKHLAQKEVVRQVTQAIAPSVAKSVVSNSAGIIASVAAMSSGTASTTALISTLVLAPTAPVVAPILAAIAVGYAASKVIDWFLDWD